MIKKGIWMMKEETKNMQPSQAFWFSFVNQEIPKDLLDPHWKTLGKISSLIGVSKDEVVASVRDEATPMRAYGSPRARDVDTGDDMSPERSFYFQLANIALV